jgi:hypothetical protein
VGECAGPDRLAVRQLPHLRGLRTLDARLRVHQENTRRWCDCSTPSGGARVHYPGLASHPGHALAAKQQLGFGAMLSVELKGGSEDRPRIPRRLQCFTLAESLGGVERPDRASGDDDALQQWRPKPAAAAAIGDGLLRLSVGIEHADDLVADHRGRTGSRRRARQWRQTRGEMSASRRPSRARRRQAGVRVHANAGARVAPARYRYRGPGLCWHGWRRGPAPRWGGRLHLVHVANSRVHAGDPTGVCTRRDRAEALASRGSAQQLRSSLGRHSAVRGAGCRAAS